jgi:hypothetical protein
VIDVFAPGKKKWSTTVNIGAKAAKETVTIPMLEEDPTAVVAPPPPPPPPTATTTIAPPPPPPPTATTTGNVIEPTGPTTKDTVTSSGNVQRTIGLVVGGIGLAGLATGTIFAFRAKGKDSDASGHCRPDAPNLCDGDGVSLGAEAHDAAKYSTVFMVLGGVALAGGALLYLTAPTAPVKVGVSGFTTGTTTGVSLGGAF